MRCNRMPVLPFSLHPAVCSLLWAVYLDRSGSDVGFGSTFASGGQQATIEMRGCAESSVKVDRAASFSPLIRAWHTLGIVGCKCCAVVLGRQTLTTNLGHGFTSQKLSESIQAGLVCPT